ncbi:MAG: GNAT family N-acetyltransferase [Xylophilus ampelinus]
MTEPILRIQTSPHDVPAAAWDALLAGQPHPSPFLRHAYLAALHDSGSATADTGWAPVFFTLWRGEALGAACVLYLKNHSYGEYVFDWAWANAYAQHGLDYYPKAVAAVPFTPVPGARLLARDAADRRLLADALLAWCAEQSLSSLHLLFGADEDIAACAEAGMMLRHTVQFHWRNAAPGTADGAPSPAPSARPDAPPGASAGVGDPGPGCGGGRRYRDFEDFLHGLSHEKRKKIRQERRKVAAAGVAFRWSRGADIAPADWDFFYRCYERTYREHGNAPYLRRDFFRRMARDMPEHWLLFVAEREGRPIASSLIALGAGSAGAAALPDGQDGAAPDRQVAFGRYWGALERVDCLHFEACYYQPLAWCIAHGFDRFEGGAQGEHKMARALMPVRTTSAHWLAHPAFADAVERFLEREGQGIDGYLDALADRSPFRHPAPEPDDAAA